MHCEKEFKNIPMVSHGSFSPYNICHCGHNIFSRSGEKYIPENGNVMGKSVGGWQRGFKRRLLSFGC
jgi:hypothetical protein